jgi:NAD(P) transhydrogenase
MSAQVAVTSSAPSRAAAPRRPNTHPRALLPTRRSKFANGGKIFRASKVVRRSATVDAPKVVAVTNVVRGSRPGYVTFRGGSTGSISFKAVSAPEDVSTVLPGRAYESMTIGIPKESFKGERRVAMAPETCGKLVKAGFNVSVEKNAGVESEYSDEDYAKEGCRIVNDAWKNVDIIAKIRPPTKSEVSHKLTDGQILFSNVYPRQDAALVESLRVKGVTTFGLDCVPRTISRAQAFDTLSSMANISGYRAIVEAANAFPRFFAGQFTMAGNVPPAKVLVVGAGVAGLAAIQTAKNMGAIVRAFDVRAAAREQVESMGAEFLQVVSFFFILFSVGN